MGRKIKNTEKNANRTQQPPSNIDQSGQKQRMVMAIVFLILSLLYIGWYSLYGSNPRWLFILFLPFMISSLGYLQAREKT